MSASSKTLVLALVAMPIAVGLPVVGQAAQDLETCSGSYALCAASTCQATGSSITVNVESGGTASFPEYNCTCPVLSGSAIADLNGGNMQGSCDAPAGKIWSLYSPQSQIPQATTGWATTSPQDDATILACPASLNLGNQLVNCFSFSCDPAGQLNGVPVATCHCPLGEALNGTPVAPNTAFATQAGQGNEAFCAMHPVSVPLGH